MAARHHKTFNAYAAHDIGFTPASGGVWIKTDQQPARGDAASAGDGGAFVETVADGVSANLCEALVQLIELFSSLDIGVSWARTRPSTIPGAPICFERADAPILREAARSFRDRAPQPDVRLYGFVGLLKRAEEDEDGSIRLATRIDGQPQSVAAVLEQRDYERAVRAHGDRALVVLTGDLERIGQRWQLLNPTVSEVIQDHKSEIDSSV